MKVLGAIIGGGRSRRFGSDKAAALMDGVALIDHVHAALQEQVDAVVVCGRQWRDWTSLSDQPEPDLGPLGGLNAALTHGRLHGYEWVLSVPVDTLPLPSGLVSMLAPGPACIFDQRLIGLWPTSQSARLADHVADGHRSVRSWVDVSGARLVTLNGVTFTNVNHAADLAGREMG